VTDKTSSNHPNSSSQYSDYESKVTAQHLQVGCWLIVFLMPAGVILDYFMYPDQLRFFLQLRVACSILALLGWVLYKTSMGQGHPQTLGLVLAMLPVFFMSWMIYDIGEPNSPYYAGLNLVLVSMALVLRWEVRLSLIAFVLVISMYLAATIPHVSAKGFTGLFNSLYFLTLTGVIVIFGSRVYRGLRVSEYTLRSQLEESNHKLAKQNQTLESTIEQLKETEMQLVQSEKLASLGRMSAGIIHEINNPLNFTAMGVFMLKNKSKLLPADQQQEYTDILKDVEDGVERVKVIVSDLRMFTHPDTESREQVEVAAVVDSALRFLSGEWREKVQIEQNLAEQQTVWANRNKLIHVLVNLLQNSFDALSHKPFDNGEKPTIWINGLVENGSSKLIIRDNGEGIKAENLDKIFDPFFTTKDVGEGMGLGLSICHRIIRECNGRIRVQSQPGKFCEFTLEFPVKG
jgi:two-component system, sensor histidine kinase PhcS